MNLVGVSLPVTELDRANAMFKRILYTMPLELELKPAKEPQMRIHAREADCY